MAFQFSNEGVPYHQPVAPVVPQPDNTAAKLVGQGGEAGVMGFVHMAIAAQQAKVEQQQMLQQADLKAQDLQHEDQWHQQTYEVAKQNANTMQQYRLDYAKEQEAAATALNTLRTSTANLNDEKRKQLQEGILTAGQAQLQFATTMAGLNNEFMGRVMELHANDPKIQTKDPLAFADAVTALQTEYPAAPNGSGIQKQLSNLQKIADTQRTTIKWGDSGTKSVTYQQLLAGLRNPDSHDAYYQGLLDAGHSIPGKEDTGQVKPFSFSHPFDSIWDRVYGVTAKKSVTNPDPFASKILSQQNKFDPSTEKSRIPEDMPRSALDLRARMMPTPANINDASTGKVNSSPALAPEPDPTPTDVLHQQAAAALAAGRDPAAVRQMLIDAGGDPSSVPGL